MTLSAFAAAVDRRDRQTDGHPTVTSTLLRYYADNVNPELESRPLEWRSAGTGRCAYRVRGVEGSCAKHLTIEFYTVVMPLTFTLSLPFLLHTGLTPRIPRTVYRSF